MAEIVNLRRVKKAAQRASAASDADAMRRLHGRTRAQKALDAHEKTRREQVLNNAKLDRNHDTPDGRLAEGQGPSGDS